MLTPHDIPVGMWYFLRVLWEEDGLSQREICSRAGAKPPTGAEQLRNMEQRGLVRRSASASDRRKVEYRLTPEGRSLETVLMPIPQALERRALDGLSAGETGFVRLALMRIQDNLVTFAGSGSDDIGED